MLLCNNFSDFSIENVMVWYRFRIRCLSQNKRAYFRATIYPTQIFSGNQYNNRYITYITTHILLLFQHFSPTVPPPFNTVQVGCEILCVEWRTHWTILCGAELKGKSECSRGNTALKCIVFDVLYSKRVECRVTCV